MLLARSGYHSGTLDLEQSSESVEGAAFLFTIPAATNEIGHDTEIQYMSGR